MVWVTVGGVIPEGGRDYSGRSCETGRL